MKSLAASAMRVFWAVSLLVFTSQVLARDVTGKITELISYSDGHSFIAIENGPANGCTDLYHYSLGVKGQDVKAENMLAIALSAYMAGKPVHISTSDGDCQGGQEKITFIKLQ